MAFDQCRECVLRGNIERCRAEVDCGAKQSWYVKQLEAAQAQEPSATNTGMDAIALEDKISSIITRGVVAGSGSGVMAREIMAAVAQHYHNAGHKLPV